MLTCGPGAGRPAACQCTSRSRGLVRYPAGDPGGDHGGQAPVQPGALARGGRGVDRLLHVGDLDVLAGDRGDDRGHEPLAQPPLGVGVLGRPRPARPGAGPGDRYQAIRSAPGRSRFGASAVSRSVTFSSLAASRSSVAASHCRRAPFSFHTARHRPPSPRAGYTVTPHSSSTTTRPSPRLAGHRREQSRCFLAGAGGAYLPGYAARRRCRMGCVRLRRPLGAAASQRLL